MQSNPSKKLSKKIQSGKTEREPESVTIEDLSKTQIILLMFLVAFVTAIITGITVVTLLDQAPQAVTQTINRVVQKTIETVIPSTGKEEIKTEIPQVVIDKEEEYIKIIEQSSHNIAYAESEEINNANVVMKFSIGYGYFISNEYFIVPNVDISEHKSNIKIKYNDLFYEASFLGFSDANFSVLKLKENTTLPKLDIKPLENVDIASLKPGKNVTIIYGTPYSVVKGMVSSVVEAKDPKGIYIITVERLKTKDDTGALVIDSSGKFVGLVAESDSGSVELLEMNLIQKEIEKMSTI